MAFSQILVVISRKDKAIVRHATEFSIFLAEFCCTTKLVTCLTLQVAQLLTSHKTNSLDRNRLCSRQLCRATKLSEKVDQLCCMSDIGLRLTGNFSWLELITVLWHCWFLIRQLDAIKMCLSYHQTLSFGRLCKNVSCLNKNSVFNSGECHKSLTLRVYIWNAVLVLK